jgi:hypothetical protein
MLDNSQDENIVKIDQIQFMLTLMITDDFDILIPYTHLNAVQGFIDAVQHCTDGDFVVYENDDWKITLTSGYTTNISFYQIKDGKSELMLHIYNPNTGVYTSNVIINVFESAMVPTSISVDSKRLKQKYGTLEFSRVKKFFAEYGAVWRDKLKDLNLPNQSIKVADLEVKRSAFILSAMYLMLLDSKNMRDFSQSIVDEKRKKDKEEKDNKRKEMTTRYDQMFNEMITIWSRSNRRERILDIMVGAFLLFLLSICMWGIYISCFKESETNEHQIEKSQTNEHQIEN